MSAGPSSHLRVALASMCDGQMTLIVGAAWNAAFLWAETIANHWIASVRPTGESPMCARIHTLTAGVDGRAPWR